MSQSGFTVNLASSFAAGDLDTKFFVDLPAMTDDQLVALTKFIDHVREGKPLKGKNKVHRGFPGKAAFIFKKK